MSQGSLQLGDEEFFTAPYKNRSQVERPLIMERKEAFVADAPKQVSLDLRQSLPMVVIRVASFARTVGVPFEKYGIVVAADAESGRVITRSCRVM